MKQISLDTEVSVRLTDQGANQLVKNAGIASKYDYHFEDGNLVISLKGLMNIFGPNISNSNFFYDGIFKIDEKGIEEYNPKTR